MISSNDFRNGVTVEMDGDAWQVVEFQHVKPGKGAAFVRAKMKNIRTGAVVERTFNAGEKMARAHLDNRQMQYLYESDGAYNFMDNENFEQFVLSADVIGDAMKFITENSNVTVVFCDGEALTVQLPPAVELEIVETEDAARGDTVSNVQKPATCNTGLEIKVPAHIKKGEKVRVSTDTGEFMGRA